MKINTLIVETIVIMGALLVGGLIAVVALRPNSAAPIVLVVTGLAGVAVSTVLQLRGIKSNSAKLDTVQATANQAVKQTNGINTVLLSNLQALVKHTTGEQPLTTGEVEVIRDSVNDQHKSISQVKGE